jgi:hypothetical protein
MVVCETQTTAGKKLVKASAPVKLLRSEVDQTLKAMKVIKKILTGIKNKFGLNGLSTGNDLTAVPIFIQK